MILVLLLVLISVGYAVLSISNNISGISKIKNADWDIHFDNVSINPNSVEIEDDHISSGALIDENDSTKVDFNIQLKKPGDFYEFTVDAVNEGTMDGMVEVVTSTIKLGEEELDITELPRWLIYNVSYLDGSKIEKEHKLLAGKSETYKVRLEYSKDINEDELPRSNLSITTSFQVYYVQDDKKIYDGYLIHYNGNGNTSGVMEDSTCRIDDNCTLKTNNYLKEGYQFKGWRLF